MKAVPVKPLSNLLQRRPRCDIVRWACLPYTGSAPEYLEVGRFLNTPSIRGMLNIVRVWRIPQAILVCVDQLDDTSSVRLKESALLSLCLIRNILSCSYLFS